MACLNSEMSNSCGAKLTSSEVDRILDENLVDKFELLRGTPGHCLDVVSWEEAKKLISEGSSESLGQLGRHPSSTVIYRKFRRKVLEEYASIMDYVRITIMNYPYTINPDGQKVVDQNKKHSFSPCWRPNDFPYYFEKGVEHHNLWAQFPLSDEEIIEEIKRNRQGYEFVYFVNPPPLASIPGLWHAHIVSRRKGMQ